MENVLKMLERRELIDSWEDHFKKISSDTTGKTVFDIEVKDKKKYSIYLVNAKLTSIVQGTPLDEYLSNNLDAFHSSDGASHLIGKQSTSIIANKWTHLVFSRINGNAKIYLDGVEKLSYALVGSLVASGNSRIGSLPGFTDRNHSGNVAITRIYKGKGLTSTEVLTHFDLTKSRFSL